MLSKDAAAPSRCQIFHIKETANQAADALLENKVYLYKEDMEELLETADALLPDDLLKDYTDDPDISINFEAWGRYKQIVRGIYAAANTGWGLRQIRYRQAPDSVNNFANVTITLPKSCAFTDNARTALIMAALLSDKITTATDKGKTQICFTVDNIQ